MFECRARICGLVSGAIYYLVIAMVIVAFSFDV